MGGALNLGTKPDLALLMRSSLSGKETALWQTFPAWPAECQSAGTTCEAAVCSRSLEGFMIEGTRMMGVGGWVGQGDLWAEGLHVPGGHLRERSPGWGWNRPTEPSESPVRGSEACGMPLPENPPGPSSVCAQHHSFPFKTGVLLPFSGREMAPGDLGWGGDTRMMMRPSPQLLAYEVGGRGR